MKREFLKLSGITKRDRNQAITEINTAISEAGGWIIDHTLFSNIAITLQLELPGEGIEGFNKSLVMSEVILQDDSQLDLEQAIKTLSQSTIEIKTTLNVTFIHNEPDLRREVAAVPG